MDIPEFCRGDEAFLLMKGMRGGPVYVFCTDRGVETYKNGEAIMWSIGSLSADARVYIHVCLLSVRDPLHVSLDDVERWIARLEEAETEECADGTARTARAHRRLSAVSSCPRLPGTLSP